MNSVVLSGGSIALPSPMHQRARGYAEMKLVSCSRVLSSRSAMLSMHREGGDAKLIQELAFLAPFAICTLHQSRQSPRLITCFCAEAEDAKLLGNLYSEMSSEQDIIEPDQLIQIKVGNSFFFPDEFYGDDKLYRQLGLSSGGTPRPELEHVRNWQHVSVDEVYLNGRVYNTRDVEFKRLIGANFTKHMDACSEMLQRLQGSLSDQQQEAVDAKLLGNLDSEMSSEQDIIEPDQLIQIKVGNSFFSPDEFYGDDKLDRQLGLSSGGTPTSELEHVRNWQRVSVDEVYLNGRVYNTRDVEFKRLSGANFTKHMDACSEMLQRLQGSLSDQQQEQDIIEPNQLIQIKVGNSFFSPDEFYGDDKLYRQLGLSSGGTPRPELEHVRNWQHVSVDEVYLNGRVYNTRKIKQ